MIQLLALCLAPAAAAFQAAPVDPLHQGEPQIDWQRSLGDALAIARAENRRLLIAINADGESASERMVRERYRDPQFVAWTRPFVCVVGSVFRHAPRDVDFEGQRVECPRLGAVTCGEHMALEPLAHERFLAGAEIELDGELVERISPRHALVDPAGRVDFDLFLLFDLETLDRELRAAAEQAAPVPAPQLPTDWPAAAGAERRARLRALARERSNAGRTALEALTRERSDERALALADALLHGGDAGSAHALAALARALGPARTAFVARTIGAERALAFELQGSLQARGLGRPLEGGQPDLELALLERSAPETSRTLRLSHQAFPSAALAELLRAAAAQRPPPPPPAVDERPSAEHYEAELAELDGRLAAAPADPELRRAHGRALLGLARRRIESGAGGAGFLLEDAALDLERAAEAFPDDVELHLERARCAYYRSEFEAQERAARAALAAAGGDPDARHEALRWLGDAGARLIVPRSQGDARTELEGLSSTAGALAEVARGPEADATDWVSLASFLGAGGRPGEQCAAAAEGLERFAESDELRAVYAAGAAWVGAPELLARAYEDLAARRADSGAAAWYAGWGLVNLAEWQRRGEQPDAALATYARAEPFFRRALEQRPDFQDSSEHYLALCALGRGFAHLLADRRAEAADALVEAVARRPEIAGARDGLEREALDLVDGALEWRRSGASPVDGVALAQRLIAADPDRSAWAGAVADALLREGLRALGRGAALERGLNDLRGSVTAARAALEVADDPLARQALAQSATTLAEVLLAQGLETAEPGALLAEAAGALGLDPPAPGAELVSAAAALRERLGPARPVARPGR